MMVPRSGPEIRAERVTTGAIAGAAEANVTVVWSRPFNTADYVAVAIVELNENGESLRVRRLVSKTAAECVFNVVNNSIITRTGVVHAIAVPDQEG